MSKIVTGQSVNQRDSRINASSSGAERSRKKVEIANDTWLVVLKFLTGWENWTSMRFVSFQVNGLIENNASRLPMVVIENATTNKAVDEFELRLTDHFWNSHKAHSLQVLYHPVLFTRNVYLNLRQLDLSSALSADVSGYIRCGKFMLEDNFCNINKFRDYLSWTEHNVRADQICFSKYSCNSKAQLDAMFDFIFGTLRMCAKEVRMSERPHYASECFLNTLIDLSTSYFDGSNVETFLQCDKRPPRPYADKKPAGFLLSQEEKPLFLADKEHSLGVTPPQGNHSKFQTISVIDSRIPTIVIIAYPASEYYRKHFRSNLIESGNDNPGVYLISNEDNRMRISLCNRTPERAMSDGLDVYVKFYTV